MTFHILESEVFKTFRKLQHKLRNEHKLKIEIAEDLRPGNMPHDCISGC
jgi:hypothetical protein